MGQSFKERIENAHPAWSQLLKRSTPMVRQALVAGGAAGEIAVTGIQKGDQLVAVIESATSSAVLTDRSAEFIANTDEGQLIRKDGYIDNTGGTATTNDNLLVTWIAWAD